MGDAPTFEDLGIGVNVGVVVTDMVGVVAEDFVDEHQFLQSIRSENSIRIVNLIPCI